MCSHITLTGPQRSSLALHLERAPGATSSVALAACGAHSVLLSLCCCGETGVQHLSGVKPPVLPMPALNCQSAGSVQGWLTAVTSNFTSQLPHERDARGLTAPGW